MFVSATLSSAQVGVQFVSGPISGPIGSPSPSASPSASPSTSPSPSATASPSATPNPNDGDRASGRVEYTTSNIDREASLFVRETQGGIEAHGYFKYKDDADNSYRVEVECVRVEGDTAWFEGPVTKASNPAWVGQWLFGKTVDEAKPGDNADTVSGSFVSSDPSCTRTETMANPANGPFTVQDGDIKVRDR